MRLVLLLLAASKCFASFIGSGKTLYEKATSKVHLYNTVPGQTMPGDTLPFYNELVDENGSPVGIASGVCTYLDVTTLIWECSYTISVDDGDITFFGDLKQGKQCSVQVMVTGTGSYSNAEGTDTLCWPEDGSVDYEHKIEIKSKASPNFEKSLVEFANVQTHIYYSSQGIKSAGDLNPFYNQLYNSEKNKQLGSLYGSCTYLQVDPIIQQCYSVYELEDGKIGSMGILKQAEECAPQAIGGGSGKYLGAQGVMDLCWPDGILGNYTHGINMEEPSIKPNGQFVLIEKPNSNIHIYNTQYGVVSEGDIIPFTNPLFDETGEVEIGTLYGVCTYVKVSPRQWACELTYETEAGQVMVVGNFGDTKECQNLGILGGTNSFEGADGQVNVCWPSSGDTYTHTINFDDSQKKDASSSTLKTTVSKALVYAVVLTAFYTL